ncbi:MAG: hypothetical protein AAGA54_07210 [Myxococcota bacterium]
MTPRVLRFASALALTTAAACSYAYPYEVDVTIATDVEAPEDANLLLVSGPGPDIEDAYVDVSIPFGEAGREYRHGAASLNASEVYLFAFIDLDGNEAWDPGEPWGEHPENPANLDLEATYIADILIEPDDVE